MMLDLENLSEAEREIVLYLMRDHYMAEGVSSTQLADQFSHTMDLHTVLHHLIDEGWISAAGQPPALTYRINLPRKRGTRSSVLSDLY
jgi:hypothetical protein